MELGINGKVALVTAASKGLGKACAMGLAAEGARLAICARTTADIQAAAAEIQAKTGGEVLALSCDVTQPTDVGRLVTQAMERYGGVDILVANAGGPPRGNFDEVTDDDWRLAFELSLLSVVRLIRAVLPSMQQRHWGRVITIQSASVKQPLSGLLLSNAVRPGTAGLIKTLANEYGRHNILFNTVCPGRIMTDRLIGGHKQTGKTVDEYLKGLGSDIPVGRVGTPEEFANMVVFLASERASYVNGVAIQIDGGMVRGLL